MRCASRRSSPRARLKRENEEPRSDPRQRAMRLPGIAGHPDLPPCGDAVGTGWHPPAAACSSAATGRLGQVRSRRGCSISSRGAPMAAFVDPELRHHAAGSMAEIELFGTEAGAEGPGSVIPSDRRHRSSRRHGGTLLLGGSPTCRWRPRPARWCASRRGRPSGASAARPACPSMCAWSQRPISEAAGVRMAEGRFRQGSLLSAERRARIVVPALAARRRRRSWPASFGERAVEQKW